ncbi:ATP-grasp domain-containing protein [Kitasatospora sp. NPDC085895]|uniref:ATP-grasp domain-containing protein n=1 Tax=Kitasatospora sp. NPDC085895 TaxID=3155057 RepID=UPI00344B7A3D
MAVIHQAIAPPVLDGAVKPANPQGYLDSAADIAHALLRRGHAVVTPCSSPRPGQDGDWAYPDAAAGIADAVAAGARVVWANTTLFRSHPLSGFAARTDLKVVGQGLRTVERFEDKRVCHLMCREAGLPVPRQSVVDLGPAAGSAARSVESVLTDGHWTFPVVVKPLRGRGSDGVLVVGSAAEAVAHIEALAASGATAPDGRPVSRYGNRYLIEEFLPGDEWTVTVMPPGRYRTPDGTGQVAKPWALPPIGRTGHQDGVLPYSGRVPVSSNSTPVRTTHALGEALRSCEEAAHRIGITAPIRIDCRQDAQGRVRLFDINLKPNMTGPGRPGREHMTNLAGMAAEAIGWSYPDLLTAMADNAVPIGRTTQ